MDNRLDWVLFAVIVCALAAGIYVWQQRAGDAPQGAPAVRTETAPKPAAETTPQVQFPVPQTGDSSSLPSLEQSDSSIRALLASLFGRGVFEEYFSPQNIIIRIVATVDNLPREKAAQRLMPVRPATGPLGLAGHGTRTIGAENSVRYRPYVAMLESVDTGKLVAAYLRYYPLFQQAYRELGYPSGYFNDRLVQVIDHLLAAPEVKSPVELVQHKVLYEFADPELEARSAGQKILIRIGPENAAKAKTWLRAFRRELTAKSPRS